MQPFLAARWNLGERGVEDAAPYGAAKCSLTTLLGTAGRGALRMYDDFLGS